MTASVCCCAAGNGVIVHSSEGMGLVAVDRSTVPVNGGNITLSFGAYPDEIPGRVRFLHPLHNFAIVSYDPRSLSGQVGLTSKFTPHTCSAVGILDTSTCTQLLLHIANCLRAGTGCVAKLAIVSVALLWSTVAFFAVILATYRTSLQHPYTCSP